MNPFLELGKLIKGNQQIKQYVSKDLGSSVPYCSQISFSNILPLQYISPIVSLQYVSNMPPICFHHDQASPCCFGQQCGHAAKAQQLLETDLKTLRHVLELSIPTYQAKPCRTLHP